MGKRISLEDVKVASQEIGETTRPTTDLCMYLRQKHDVSERVVQTAYRKAIEQGAIKQVWATRWVKNEGHHAVGMYNVPTSFCVWKVTDG